jgi:hypothetical protein
MPGLWLEVLSIRKDLSMSLKRKLLGLVLLAAMAVASLVVMSASASNREGHWATPVAKAQITGFEKPTHTMEFSLEGVVAKGIVCEVGQWDTTTNEKTPSSLEIIPTLDKCKTTSGTAGEVKIKVNACVFDLFVAKGTTATTEQTADIACPLGPMEITHLGCTITIGSQNNLTGITYKDVKLTETAVTGSFNVKLAAKADGATCAKGITGAKLSGALTFEAFDPSVPKVVPIEVT